MYTYTNIDKNATQGGDVNYFLKKLEDSLSKIYSTNQMNSSKMVGKKKCHTELKFSKKPSTSQTKGKEKNTERKF